MPDPLDTNDDWADLAREFNLDKPAAPPPAEKVERPLDEELVESQTDDDADDEADDAEDAPGEATADGEQPDTGRKRRRRRRRRRKGVPAEGAVNACGPEEVAEDEVEAEAEEEPVAEGDDFGNDDSGAETEYAEDEAAPLVVEEDTASDVLRDLIATWNVPAWDDIIGGLYRPN